MDSWVMKCDSASTLSIYLSIYTYTIIIENKLKFNVKRVLESVKYSAIWTKMKHNITFSFMYKIRKKSGDTRGVMINVVGNEHGDTSSNPGRDWLYFT